MVILIQRPDIDFNSFIATTHQALGYNIAEQVDRSPVLRSDADRFLSCLSAFRSAESAAGFTPHLLSHVSFSFLIAADERDMVDILETCAGMSFVTSDSVSRAILIAVITGTLAQWRDACITGSARTSELAVRRMFNVIANQLQSIGVWVWGGTQPLADGTFLLEDKRK